MKSETKQTLFEVLITAIVSVVMVTLFNRYKEKLPKSMHVWNHKDSNKSEE